MNRTEVCLLFLLAVTGPTMPARAVLITESEIKIIGGAGGTEFDDACCALLQTNGKLSLASLTEHSTLKGYPGSADISGTVSSGVSRLSISIDGNVTGTTNSTIRGFASVETQATASFIDEFTPDSATESDGAPILVSAHLLLNGTLDGQASGSGGNVAMGIQVTGTGIVAPPPSQPAGLPQGNYIGIVKADAVTPATDVNQQAPGSIPIFLFGVVGAPTQINYLLQINAIANAAGGADVGTSGAAGLLIDYTHTLTWGGIDSVMDRNTGQPLPLGDFSFTSQLSGFDYAKPTPPVPEPGSAFLAILAMLILPMKFRR
jgi:hypothetical protein